MQEVRQVAVHQVAMSVNIFIGTEHHIIHNMQEYRIHSNIRRNFFPDTSSKKWGVVS
jgi:hypothetical protein